MSATVFRCSTSGGVRVERVVFVRLHFGDIAETESAKSNVDIFDTAHHLACIAIG